MKQNISKLFTPYFSVILLAIFGLTMLSCSETPDQFFGTAVLNTNAINDFATPNLAKHINDETIEFADIPSSKNKGDEAITFVNNKILYLEKSLNDIKALNANADDRKAIKEKSLALYEFVIPIYKNEYTNYAKLCDSKADPAKKEEAVKLIEQKYSSTFEKMYIDLMDAGKAFADENKLNVDWR